MSAFWLTDEQEAIREGVQRTIARFDDEYWRETDATDRRLRLAVATEDGRAMARRIDAARERMGRKALAGWSMDEIDTLARLMQRYASAVDAVAEG